MHKLCSNCSVDAQFSLVAIISTVGMKGRPQKTSRAVLFCNECLLEFTEHLCSDAFAKVVNGALTQLHECLLERSQTTKNISD
jgi:hypothetical protein